MIVCCQAMADATAFVCVLQHKSVSRLKNKRETGFFFGVMRCEKGSRDGADGNKMECFVYNWKKNVMKTTDKTKDGRKISFSQHFSFGFFFRGSTIFIWCDKYPLPVCLLVYLRVLSLRLIRVNMFWTLIPFPRSAYILCRIMMHNDVKLHISYLFNFFRDSSSLHISFHHYFARVLSRDWTLTETRNKFMSTTKNARDLICYGRKLLWKIVANSVHFDRQKIVRSAIGIQRKHETIFTWSNFKCILTIA